MRSRRDPGLAGNPVLIGALTVLVTFVAVYLAYNATNGLPFVPTYKLHVQAADASELSHGDEVNMGGALVGLVSTVTPKRLPNGRAIAILNLQLQNSIKPLPVDSKFTVRLKGAIGLKYLEITLGHSRRGFAQNAVVPMRQESTDVDFDQVLSMFNPKTRIGVQQSTIGFGEALAGRGYDINNAIGAFGPLLRDLQPVAANLASPATNLGGFFRSLETPPMFDATIANTPVIRPFLTDTAGLFSQLRPGVATLPQSAPVLSSAFAIGTRNLPGTAALDRRTVTLSKNTASYAQNPSVQKGLDRLTLTLSRLGPPLAFLTPAQTTCNYVTLFLRNSESTLSEHVSQGSLLRFVQIAIDDVPGYESEPSSVPFTGTSTGQASGPLHVDPYPNTASPGQTRECSSGNEPYPQHAVLGNPSGNVGIKTEKTTRSGS
jgi:ABC-type transporter Mla subunit MlaD